MLLFSIHELFSHVSSSPQSMFVEVMGLQMNTERLNQTKMVKSSGNTNGSSLFQFPSDIPPPPGGWPEDLLWPHEEEDNDENASVDSLPNLEEIPDGERPLMIEKQKARLAELHRQQQAYKPFPPVPGSKPVSDLNVAPVIRSEGIAPFEWSALERSAIENALEQEERIRKDAAASTTTPSTPLSKKKQSQQPTLTNSWKKPPVITQKDATAALKKVEVANKKLGKAVLTWRNRVTAAIHQNEVNRLSSLLEESPLPAVIHLHQQAASALSQQDATSSIQDEKLLSMSNRQHWEALVPLAVPKSRSLKGSESRTMLTKYLLHEQTPNCMFAIGRNGRSGVHTACLYGDIPTLMIIFSEARRVLSSEDFEDLLLEPCQDSGWTPLHYAAVSGNLKLVETILAASCDEDTVKIMCCATTNSMQTWKKGTNKGITPAYLAEAIVSRKSDKLIETHGMALQDSLDHFKELHTSSSPQSNFYLHLTSFIYSRLLFVESTSFEELSDQDIELVVSELKGKVESVRKSAASVASSTTTDAAREVSIDTDDESSIEAKKAKKKKKKKKKKHGTQVESTPQIPLAEQNTPSRRNPNPEVSSKDPLITALENMGFEHDKVLQGIAACGGSSRATADDVVAWIFGADAGESQPTTAADSSEDQFAKTKTRERSKSIHSISKEEAERRNIEAARQLEEERLAAEKLAAKREEQRRRNREWNNRAQARQAMEAQDRLSKSTSLRNRQPSLNSGLRTGVVPNSNFYSGVRGPTVTASSTSASTPTFNAAAQKVTRIETNPTRRETSSGSGYFGEHYGQQRAESGIDRALSNDASTVASSLGPTMFEVEITPNDDATVSTMGSFPAVPQMPTSNYAPPGFDSDGLPFSDGHNREASNLNRWDTTQRSSSFGELHAAPHSFSPFHSGQMMVPPPGIPESGPLMDRPVPHSHRSQSFNILPPTRQVPQAASSQRSMSASSAHFAPPVGMPDRSMRSLEGTHMDTSGSLLDGGLAGMPPPSSVGTGPPEFGNDQSQIPGLLGFGSSTNPRAPPLDSAIIDSISTSNTGLGMSDLWSDSKAMGSSLLDTLLESHDTPTESITGVVPGSGFFPAAEESLHSGGDQQPTTWQGGISRSQSVSSAGGTGGPPSGSIW